MLHDDLEGWDREEGREGNGDIYMHMADSLCFTTETNTVL